MVPALLIMFGLGYIVGFLSYLQRRWNWIWGAVLLVCCMGLFSMFEENIPLVRKYMQLLNMKYAGGLVGQFFYDHGLEHMLARWEGALFWRDCIIISLLYLTNFRLGRMVPRMVGHPLRQRGPAAALVNENELERRARLLEKQARRLQEQLDKSGKGAVAAGRAGWAPTCSRCRNRWCAI